MGKRSCRCCCILRHLRTAFAGSATHKQRSYLRCGRTCFVFSVPRILTFPAARREGIGSSLPSCVLFAPDCNYQFCLLPFLSSPMLTHGVSLSGLACMDALFFTPSCCLPTITTTSGWFIFAIALLLPAMAFKKRLVYAKGATRAGEETAYVPLYRRSAY